MLLTVVIVRTAVHTRFYDVTQLRMLLLSNFPGSLLYIPRTSDGCQLEYFSGNVIKLRAVYEFVFQTVLSGDLQIRRICTVYLTMLVCADVHSWKQRWKS